MNFQILIIMKVYCPSHNRPDAVLFSMTTGLNIVIQDEEDLKQYSKWEDRHNVIYNPELKGLLDVRNWILEQADNWVMMIDDDVLGIKKETHFGDNISWDSFYNKTNEILKKLDKDKIGVVGYNIYGDNIYKKEYEIDDNFDIYQIVILNAPLLKSKGFKYESYPFDGVGGQKAHCEDSTLLYFCYINNIPIVRINSLFVYFDQWNSPTVAWGTNKNKEKMLILVGLWTIYKYKDYPKIINGKVDCINYMLYGDRKKFNDRNELYNEIVKEVSYETLNKDEGEEIMKKNVLIGGLIVLLMAGSLVGCPEKDDGGEETGNGYNGKTVADEFIGDWWARDDNYRDNPVYTVSKTTLLYIDGYGDIITTYAAWSEGNELWVAAKFTHTSGYDTPEKLATLQDGNLVTRTSTTLIKK